jgi:hypothetical protein
MEPSRGKSICIPFESEDHYAICVVDPDRFRQYRMDLHSRHPELLPAGFEQGFIFHDKTWSIKQRVLTRRLRLMATGQLYQVRPSFLMPSMTARTERVERGLYLRQWGVPFEALAYLFGRDAMCWYRAEVALGRPSLVGTPSKCPEKLPEHLLADEKHTGLEGHKRYLSTTVAGGCLRGASVTSSASTEALEAAYGEFADEARALNPAYSPKTVCTDGWEATQNAWQRLFPGICIILCFLHAVLKIGERCVRNLPLRTSLVDKAGSVYEAVTRAQFSQRLRRFREWGLKHTSLGPLRDAVLSLCNKGPRFACAYSHRGAHRTSNAVDRLMNYQDRRLYAMGYFHGTLESARLAVRAMALLWNFHPYGTRIRRDSPTRRSPFHDLNGFHYHDNWLHNLLIASSMGGRKL